MSKIDKLESGKYFPSKVTIDANQTKVRFSKVRERGFSSSFLQADLDTKDSFTQNLTDYLQKPLRRKAAAPSAFIFHTGRAGSVLVSRMLEQLDHIEVLKEPPVLGQIFFRPQNTVSRIKDELSSLLHHIDSVMVGRNSRYIIKWSSWCALHIETISALFPDVPIIFLYRNPEEILVSNILKPASWTHWKNLIHPINNEEFDEESKQALEYAFCIEGDHGKTMSNTQYYGVILKNIFTSIAHSKANIRIVDYTSLPNALSDVILPHFNLEANQTERVAMMEQIRSHSHSPHKTFTADTQKKSRLTNIGLKTYVQKQIEPSLSKMINRFNVSSNRA